MDQNRLKTSLILLVVLFSLQTAHAKENCVGPVVDKKSFTFQPPLWTLSGDNLWRNDSDSAQIQITIHPLKKGVDLEKYGSQYPHTLEEEGIQILNKKEIQVGPLKAYMVEGKQPVSNEISKIKSISIFGKDQLFFFTLIANKKGYKEARECFDSVVQTFQLKN